MNMPRLTRSIFVDLLIYMISFGLFAGISYPFFMPLFGVNSDSVLSPLFLASSIFAGVSMGLINFLWVHVTLRPHLRVLADRMHSIELILNKNRYQEDWNTACGNQSCFIEVVSNDEIGESAQAFNALVKALIHAHDVEFALKELGQTLSSSLALSEMGESALRLMITRTASSAGCLFVEDKGRLLTIANLGINDPDKLSKDPFVLYCMDLGRKDKVSLPDDVEVNAVLTRFRPKEILIVPILYKNENQGVLVLASATGYKQEDHDLVDMFTQGLGLAMSNALTHGRLQDLAAMDPLTGIYNRRFGMGRLRDEFQKASRGQLPLAVVMLDLDHFKQINDTYGHLMGDRVLVEATQVLRGALREEDILIRYGGEEFLIVLPSADLNIGASTADRIRRLIEDMTITDDNYKLKLTASMGVSAIPRAFTENELQLIKAADDALYQAKAAGRNRVFSTR
jgi:two-component system cell cycle response regulator